LEFEIWNKETPQYFYQFSKKKQQSMATTTSLSVKKAPTNGKQNLVETLQNSKGMITGAAKVETEQIYTPVKSVLVTQPKPALKSPYFDLEAKYNIKIDFREFTHVEALDIKDVRRQRVNPGEYSSVILNSKNAVDHFFRCCKEMRVTMSEETKYFCLTETIGNYLQKFIVYRKRKVFVGNRTIEDLKNYLVKHRDKETFLLPCSNYGAKDVTKYLDDIKVKYQEVIMYQTVSSDLSDLSDVKYDVLVFFTPQAILSLYENFPDFAQLETRIAVSGKNTAQAVSEHGLAINIQPTPVAPSMPMAIENYIKIANKS
jgi:uroporphyrinogen-III synthase